MNKKFEHAVLYARSNSHSEQQFESQRVKGRQYAEQHSLQLSIIEDPHSAGSGPLKKRDGLRWLLYLVEVGLIKTVIVESSCRIRRNFVDLFYFKSLLTNHGTQLIVLDILTEVD